MKKVLITGGSGFIGSNLSRLLSDNGFLVEHVSRSKNGTEEFKTWQWNVEEGWIEEEALANSFAIIHLAGANIASTPFSEKGMNLLYDSRIKTTELLYNTAKRIDQFPELYVSASAIGYYGMRTSDQIFMEKDPPAEDLVADLCIAWEKVADKFLDHSRVAKVRIGLVLDKNEGALAKLALPIKFGLGAALGSGKQWMPWIHTKDLCSVFLAILQNGEMEGVYNGVAPEHITQKSFLKAVAQELKRPFWLPNIPAFILRLFTREKADLILESSRVSAEKLLESGFEFDFPNLKDALSDIYV